jgi:hypothetical protein
MANVDSVIQTIHTDFIQRKSPFNEDQQFPEDDLLNRIPHSSDEDTAFLLTFFCTLDYNRDAFQLVDNIVELYEEEDFPLQVTKFSDRYTQDRLEELFGEIGFRYPSRDARGVMYNFEYFSDTYERITYFIDSVEFSAPQLVQALRDEELLYLKGKKLAPFYTRLLSVNVVALDNLWELDIPVDVHIRRLSKSLFEESAEDLSDDQIRKIWRSKGHELDISPAVVDGALWLIGNNWGTWGETYWNNPSAYQPEEETNSSN